MELNKLLEFAPYLIYGYLLVEIWKLITPSKEHKVSEIYIEIFIYGFFMKKIDEFLESLKINIGINETIYSLKNLIMVILIVLLPLLLNKILKLKILKKFIVRTPIPSAWDFFFEKRQACICVIYMDNGNIVKGYCGEKSFATSYPQKREIYLEAIYKKNDEGLFRGEVEPNTLGAYINCENIIKIEFEAI